MPPQVAPTSTCPIGTAMFGVVAAGSGPFTYRWQRETTPNFNTFADLEDGPTLSWDGDTPGIGAVVSGSSTDTLFITADTTNGRRLSAPHAIRYRAVVTNECGIAESNPAHLTHTCDTDINCDGALDSGDFFAFLTAFFGDPPPPVADFNSDGAVDSNDFFAFLNAFFAGCP